MPGKNFLTEALIGRFQLDSIMAGENFEINTSIQLEMLRVKSTISTESTENYCML